jgi:hypothetical protein
MGVLATFWPAMWLPSRQGDCGRRFQGAPSRLSRTAPSFLGAHPDRPLYRRSSLQGLSTHFPWEPDAHTVVCMFPGARTPERGRGGRGRVCQFDRACAQTSQWECQTSILRKTPLQRFAIFPRRSPCGPLPPEPFLGPPVLLLHASYMPPTGLPPPCLVRRLGTRSHSLDHASKGARATPAPSSLCVASHGFP